MSDFELGRPSPIDWQHRPWHDRLDWALLTGDDFLLAEALLDGEISLAVREGLWYCNPHKRTFHLDDGCPQCG